MTASPSSVSPAHALSRSASQPPMQVPAHAGRPAGTGSVASRTVRSVRDCWRSRPDAQWSACTTAAFQDSTSWASSLGGPAGRQPPHCRMPSLSRVYSPVSAPASSDVHPTTPAWWARSRQLAPERACAPEGEGAASTGSRPRSMRHCRAVARPSRRHRMPSVLSWGTTRVMMGMGGLYLDSRLAVVPAQARRCQVRLQILRCGQARLQLPCHQTAHCGAAWSPQQRLSLATLPTSRPIHKVRAARGAPVWVNTMIRLALTLSAARTADEAMDSSLFR